MDEVDRYILFDAWLRRQQFMAQIQAAEMKKMLFGTGQNAGSQGAREISTAAMFDRIK